jgi:hypothetical protein
MSTALRLLARRTMFHAVCRQRDPDVEYLFANMDYQRLACELGWTLMIRAAPAPLALGPS